MRTYTGNSVLTLSLVLTSLDWGVAAAQGPLPPQTPLRAETTAVVIDVVAQDSHGRPVLDLSADEFELREGNVSQQIQQCILIHPNAAGGNDVQRPAAASSQAANASALPTAGLQGAARRAPLPNTPSVTAILFDRLSAEVRPLARRAALSYIDTLEPSKDYAGVFLADLSMVTLQPFTNEGSLLRAGIDKAAMWAPSNLRIEGQLTATSTQAQQLDPTTSPTAGAESPGGAVTPLERKHRLDAMNPGDHQLAVMELRMEEGYQRLLIELQGQGTVAGLRAVVDALALAPGRKSLLYFSEGIVVTARTKAFFEALIQQANRANVTVYAVDAAGLRVHSREAEVARNVAVAAAQGVGDVERDSGPWTRDLEKQEQVLTSRPTAAMGRLAAETGGFLLDNTNDLAAGVTRMRLERLNYYLLLYESTNLRRDGTYRTVTVKVKRHGVRIRARAGYIAP